MKTNARFFLFLSLLVLALASPERSFAQGYWFKQYTTTPFELHDIFFVNKYYGWAVGKFGTVLRTTNSGTNWLDVSSSSGTTKDLYAVYFVNTTDGYACGAEGTFIRTTNGGLNWSAPPQPTGLLYLTYYDLHFVSKNVGWIVGENAFIQKTVNAGSTWSVQDSNLNKTAHAITRVGTPASIYVCGDDGYFVRSTDDGISWLNSSVAGTTTDLRGISFVTKDIGFVCGEDTVYRTTNGGISWTKSVTGTLSQLNDIAMTDANSGWTIVSGGVIPFTSDAGGSWVQQSSPSGAKMNALTTFTKDHAWACGESGDIIKFALQPPHIETASELDFGVLLCELDRFERLVVKNTGQGTVDIFSAEITGANKFEFAVNLPSSFPFTLGPNDTVGFLIHWKPFAPGTKDATLEIKHSDLPRNPLVVPLIAKKDSSAFALSVNALNFPATCVGQSTERSLELNAAGTVPLEVTQIEKISGSDDFVIYSPTPPVGVGASGHVPISVRFTPSSAGNSSAEYRVTVEPCHRQATFTVNGIAIDTRVISLPDPIAFGDVTVGKSNSRTITLTTPGPTFANVTSITIDPPTPGVTITSAPPTPLRINPNEQKNVTIRFAPNDTITLNTRLCVQWDKVCDGVKCIPLLGRGVVNPHIIFPPVLVFAPLLCTTTEIDTVRLENTGTGPLVISAIELVGKDAGYFKVMDPVAPYTIEPGETAKFVLQFTAPDAGDFGAVLRLSHNDAANSPTEINVMGRKDAVAFAVIGDSTTTMKACIGTTRREQYRIVNTGSIAVQLNDVIKTIGNAPFKIVDLTTPLSIAPKGEHFFSIEFSPTAMGDEITGFDFIADKCGYRHQLTVKGRGLKSKLRPMAPIDFGSVRLGETVNISSAIQNTGNAACNVVSMFFSPPINGMAMNPAPVLPLSLDTNAVLSLPIRFAPTVEGNANTELVFIIASECPDTLRIPITAAASSATLSLNKSEWRTQLSACTIEPRCDSIRIDNLSSSAVEIQSIRVQQAGTTFSLANIPPTPHSLASNESLTLRLCANLPIAGRDSAMLIIESNDTKKPVITVRLSAVRDSVALFFSHGSLRFGTVSQCDQTETRTLRIVNTGSLDDSVRVTSPTDAAFSLRGADARRIAASSFADFMFDFHPTDFSVHTASVEVLSLACGLKKVVLLDGERRRIVPRANTDTIDFNDVNVGVPMMRTIVLSNPSNRSFTISRVEMATSNGYTSSPSLPATIDSAGTMQLSVTFSPSTVGNFPNTLRIITSNPCADTMFVVLRGNGVKSDLTFSAAQISFAATAQCEWREDSITCTNSGSLPLTIVRSSLAGNDVAQFQLLDPTTNDEVLQPSGRRTYHIRFTPSAAPDGLLTALLRIETRSPNPIVIDLPLSGVRITQSWSAPLSIDFSTMTIGGSASKDLFITNDGSAEFCISSIRVAPPFSLTASVPKCLKPGEQAMITVTFTPTDTVLRNEFIVMKVSTPCPDSIMIESRGRGSESAIRQTSSLDFGTMARCESRRDTIRLSNSGATDAMLERVAIGGIDSSLFRILSPVTFPTPVAAGSSLDIIIELAPSAAAIGSKSATFISSLTVQGVAQTHRTTLTARSTQLRIDAQPITFGSVEIGKDSSQRVVIHNRSGISVLIDAVQPLDAAFIVTQIAPPLTARLADGDSLVIDLRFTPAEARQYASMLRVHGIAPCIFDSLISVTGTGSRTTIISASLALPSLRGQLNDVIDIPILLDTDIGVAGVGEFSGEITFNRTMLYPIDVLRENTLSKNMKVQMDYDHANGRIRIHALDGSVAAGTGALVTVRCKVLLGNDVETPLRFVQAFSIMKGNARIERTSDGLFQLVGYCRAGDRLLKLTGSFSLSQNHPNPFNPTTTIEYEIAVDGFTSLVITDALGREVARPVDEWKKAGRYSVSFDARALESGVYFYTLRSGRFVEVKRMLVTR